jgi:hypothetical protein
MGSVSGLKSLPCCWLCAGMVWGGGCVGESLRTRENSLESGSVLVKSIAVGGDCPEVGWGLLRGGDEGPCGGTMGRSVRSLTLTWLGAV